MLSLADPDGVLPQFDVDNLQAQPVSHRPDKKRVWLEPEDTTLRTFDHDAVGHLVTRSVPRTLEAARRGDSSSAKTAELVPARIADCKGRVVRRQAHRNYAMLRGENLHYATLAQVIDPHELAPLRQDRPIVADRWKQTFGGRAPRMRVVK